MGTRNLLAITTTVQCVAGVVEHAVKRIRTELLPFYPHVDDVVGLEHSYGCGVAIDAPDAVIPIRTLRHISLNPNFGGEVMVVSLGCEKLQPERLLPPGSFAIGEAATQPALDVVCLQDDAHIGFDSMIDSILRQYEECVRPMHLQFVEPSKRFADVIIPGGGHNKVAIDLVKTKIRELLRERGVSVDAPVRA